MTTTPPEEEKPIWTLSFWRHGKLVSVKKLTRTDADCASDQAWAERQQEEDEDYKW